MYQPTVAVKKHPSHTRDIPKWRVSPHGGWLHAEGISPWRVSPHRERPWPGVAPLSLHLEVTFCVKLCGTEAWSWALTTCLSGDWAAPALAQQPHSWPFLSRATAAKV